ncbi:hypothetical protein EF879_26475 [Micromonospora sp. HM5-17]|nr:hypothetical protein EF879_26475 [Micromonospora sp. HM5-17]
MAVRGLTRRGLPVRGLPVGGLARRRLGVRVLVRLGGRIRGRLRPVRVLAGLAGLHGGLLNDCQ